MTRILLLSLLLCILSNSVFATETEKEVKSKITTVTVYLNGAQVTRESNVNLLKGKTILKFKGLASFIDKNSIQIKGIGNFTVLSVNHTMNYLDKTSQNTKTDQLNSQIEKLKATKEYKKTELIILNEKIDFLVTNKKVMSNEKSTSPANFKLFKDIYFSDFGTIQISILKKQREITALSKKITTLNKQIQEKNNGEDLPTSEITVTVSSQFNTNGEIRLSYYVSHAGWYPSYDIRVDNINLPVKLVYKANVYQNTGIDWNNIKMTFSNASPKESANMPVLYPYYLDFDNYKRQRNSVNCSYNPNIREVSGTVKDRTTGESIPFANILVKGSTVGTTTDMDGKFSLSIPKGAKSLLVAFVGYKEKEIGIDNSYLNILLDASTVTLDEVRVVDYKTPLITRKKMPKQKSKPIPIKMGTPDYKTTFEFKIDIPYSLKSKSNNLTINMKEIELNSTYVYKSIPKINPQAFLIANITDWEQYSLLDGEVNLYFDNTFVGKSVLDLSQLSDTLEVSLGSDKNITIKRTKQKEHTSNRFFGGNKIETKVWKTIVKNNKSEKIKILIYDQIPISNNQEIVVETQELSGAEINKDTGELVWKIELSPKESVEKTIEYTVKYPKKKYLRIE